MKAIKSGQKVNSRRSIGKMKGFFVLILFFILALVYFHPLLMGSKIFLLNAPDINDAPAFTFPTKYILSESLRQGKLPLWVSSISNGLPLFAEGQIGALYPLNLLFFKYLPWILAINLSYTLSFALAEFFMYLYLRKIRLSFLAAFFGGVVFAFSGFFIGHLQHLNLLQVAAFLPLIFFIFESYIYKNKFLLVIFLSLVISCQLLLGAHQITLYSLLAIFLYAAFHFFLKWQSERKKQPEILFSSHSLPLAAHICFPLLLAVIFAFSLSAVQLFPTLQLRTNSLRAQEVFSQSGGLGSLPRAFLTLMNPLIYGSPSNNTFSYLNVDTYFHEMYIYSGLVTFILGMLGVLLLSRKNNFVAFFSLLFFLALVFSLGNKSSFAFFFLKLPPFNFFRVPARFILLTSFSLAVLSAFTLNSIIKGGATSVKRFRLFFTLLLVIQLLDTNYFMRKTNKMVDTSYFLSEGEVAHYLRKELDLRNYRLAVVPHDGLLHRWLNDDLNGWESSGAAPYLEFYKSLPFSTNALFDLKASSGYVGLFPEVSENMKKVMFFDGVTFSDSAKTIILNYAGERLLSASSVRYIISLLDLENRNLKLLKVFPFNYGRFESIKIYELMTAVPRAYIVSEALTADSEALAWTAFFAGRDTLDYSKEVVLEKKISHEGKDIENSGAVEIINDTGEKIELKVDSPGDSFLVLTDTYYLGWQAFVDGEEAEVLKANYAFRAVKIPKGKRRVVFVYQPRSLKSGALISTSTLIIGVIYLTFKFLSHSYGNKKKNVA